MTKAAFFINEEWEQKYVEQALGNKLELSFYNYALDSDHTPEATDAELISIFVASKLGADVMEHFPNLKFIAARSTGFDHIDLDEAAKRGIQVANVPAYGANTVAQHAFALLLSLSKHICASYQALRDGGVFDQRLHRGFDLKGRTLGVIGTGNIGRKAVRMGQGFEMEVIAHDAFPDMAFAEEVGIAYLSLSELLVASDVVTVHVPYIPQTHHLINSDNIAKLKEGAVLINTSRGPVVETEALISALKSGRLHGAGLDVFEEEDVLKDELAFLTDPTPENTDFRAALANHVLIDHPNVLATPHTGANTQEALERIIATTVLNIEAYLNGAPKNIVTKQ